MIGQDYDYGVVQRTLALEHRNEVAEHLVRRLRRRPVVRPVVGRASSLRALNGVSEMMIRPMARGQVRNEERWTVIK